MFLTPLYIDVVLIFMVEGVWLSVTPTKDYLVVALDFEGLYSIAFKKHRLIDLYIRCS